VHGDGVPPGWFAALAERVNADLVAAGFPRCPHRHEARSERGPLSEWRRRFEECVDERRPLPATLLFDFRKVAGALDLAPLETAMARAARDGAFLRFLARAAVERAPPASIRLRGGEEVDLKAQGITPVVQLARCYGVEVGTPARATLDRLGAARDAGLLSPEAYESVAQAYRFLVGLRLRHELRDLAEGRPPSTRVDPSELTAIERTRLKDAFRAVRRWQDRAAYHYRTGFF
jgi:CBS domain-containing protein